MTMTEEERIAAQLRRLRAEKGVEVEILGLPYPDIICALPIEAVREVALENQGKPEAASWSELIDQHRAEAESLGKAPIFKTFVLEALGLHGWGGDKFVDEVLAVAHGQPPEASPLSRVVSSMVARVDSRSFDNGRDAGNSAKDRA